MQPKADIIIIWIIAARDSAGYLPGLIKRLTAKIERDGKRCFNQWVDWPICNREILAYLSNRLTKPHFNWGEAISK